MRCWRGTLVVPAETEWAIKHRAADLTSRSLRGAAFGSHCTENPRRGILQVEFFPKCAVVVLVTGIS